MSLDFQNAAVIGAVLGLMAVVTVTLAVGMRAMAKRQAIIRRLAAVETLGSTTVVCSDKTGRLTLNQMTVSRLYADGRFYDVDGSGYDPVGEMRADGQTVSVQGDATLECLLRAGALCNDALLTGTPPASTILGDPTEGALVVAAAKAGLRKEQLELAWPRLNEIPFMQGPFNTVPMHAFEWVMAITLGFGMFVAETLRKMLAPPPVLPRQVEAGRVIASQEVITLCM